MSARPGTSSLGHQQALHRTGLLLWKQHACGRSASAASAARASGRLVKLTTARTSYVPAGGRGLLMVQGMGEDPQQEAL